MTRIATNSLPVLKCPSDDIASSVRWCCVALASPGQSAAVVRSSGQRSAVSGQRQQSGRWMDGCDEDGLARLWLDDNGFKVSMLLGHAPRLHATGHAPGLQPAGHTPGLRTTGHAPGLQATGHLGCRPQATRLGCRPQATRLGCRPHASSV